MRCKDAASLQKREFYFRIMWLVVYWVRTVQSSELTLKSYGFLADLLLRTPFYLNTSCSEKKPYIPTILYNEYPIHQNLLDDQFSISYYILKCSGDVLIIPVLMCYYILNRCGVWLRWVFLNGIIYPGAVGVRNACFWVLLYTQLRWTLYKRCQKKVEEILSCSGYRTFTITPYPFCFDFKHKD